MRTLTLLLFLLPVFSEAQSPRINCTEAGYPLDNARSPESKGQIVAWMDQGIYILSFDEAVLILLPEGWDINNFSGEPRAVPKNKRPAKGGKMGRHTRKSAYEKKDDSETPPEPLESTPIASSGAEGGDPPEDKDKKKEDHSASAPMQKKPPKTSNLTEEDFATLETQMNKIAKKSKKEGFKPENNLQQFRIIHNILTRATKADMKRIEGMNAYQSIQPLLTSILHILDPPPGTTPPPRRVSRKMQQKVPHDLPSYGADDEDEK